MSAPWVWFQRLQFSLPVYNPRKQTDIIINLWAKLQLWYNVNFYNAVCFVLQILECCEVWGLVVQTSSRNLNSKIGFLSVYCVSLQTLTAAVADTQSSVQIGQRSSSALSLKPKQDYLISLTMVHNDFGAQENKICHSFHVFPLYLLWSDWTRCHDLISVNIKFEKAAVNIIKSK